MVLEVVFLGSSGCIRVPTFNCTCRVCEEARRNGVTRTRASIAIIGKETTVIDASPDLPSQLEREKIRKIDNLFLTHWHFDHVWGLAELVEPKFMSKWPLINVYLPEKSLTFFENSMIYLSKEINLTPVKPGDVVNTVDADYKVVKTNHSPDSVGYIVEVSKKLAYLVDSYTPPKNTIELLEDIDFLVLDAIVDEMKLLEGESRWLHFTVDEAVDFWINTGVENCILTHLTCHSLVDGQVVAGMLSKERDNYQAKHKGLVFAYDGLRIKI